MTFLTDEEIKVTEDQIRAAQSKANITGPTAAIELYTLRSKLRRMPDGAIGIEMRHPTSDVREPAFNPYAPPWLDYALRTHSVADALKLWFSDANPEVELHRRQVIIYDEARNREINSAREAIAVAKQRLVDAAERERQSAWRAQPVNVRVAARLGGDATVADLAAALANEPATGSMPPAGWVAPPKPPEVPAQRWERAERPAVHNVTVANFDANTITGVSEDFEVA